MYTASVQDIFSATHQLTFANGEKEPLHGHDWKVRAVFERSELDLIGMVVNFEDARKVLGKIVANLNHRNLNEIAAFRNCNPTAELVARHICRELHTAFGTLIRRVEVTEAPGCIASYEQFEGTAAGS